MAGLAVGSVNETADADPGAWSVPAAGFAAGVMAGAVVQRTVGAPVALPPAGAVPPGDLCAAAVPQSWPAVSQAVATAGTASLAVLSLPGKGLAQQHQAVLPAWAVAAAVAAAVQLVQPQHASVLLSSAE